MRYNVDTVIIGAGPAGTSCGIMLCRSGRSSLIVEKRTLPRDKTCGGMLTAKTCEILTKDLAFSDDELSGILCGSSDVIDLYYDAEVLTHSRVENEFRFIKRVDFDAHLAEKYRSLGGTLLEGRKATSFDLPGGTLTLDNGDSVGFRHLVASDGALSPTRRALGMKDPELALCVETHIPRSKMDFDGAVRIYFGIIQKGYAWVFPSGDAICIGIGGVEEGGVSNVELFKKCLSSLGVDPNECDLKGAFIPYGNPVAQARSPKNVLLAGDAGGFVDPVNGEGIYFALATGVAAARAVTDGGTDTKRKYLELTEPYAKMIRHGRRMQHVFYRPSILTYFRKKMRGRNGFAAYFCDHHVSHYEGPIPKLIRDYKAKKNAAR